MARMIGNILPGVILRARRLAIIADLISTYECPSDKKIMIMVLYEREIITGEWAELLIETFGVDAA